MTSKDITITYGNEIGDCTRPYYVTLGRSDITVEEFIKYVMDELKSEWGYIRIYERNIVNPWSADYEFEYSHGVAKSSEVIPPYVLASCIKTLSGSGGWSRSDWDIIIEGEKQMTYEENVRAILESNFAGFKEEVIDTACKMILGLRTYGEWIPCSEQLPKEDDTTQVLVSVNERYAFYAIILMPSRSVKTEYRLGHIDAWMELPKPYKKGDPDA